MDVLDAISALSDLVVAAVALFGAIYVVRQVREARKARLLGPYFEIDHRVHQQREDRRLLYASQPDGANDSWRHAFERVAVTFDVLGTLLREDMVYRPIVFQMYYDVIIKTWTQVEPHILQERRSGEKADTYMDGFEYLFAEAKEYVTKKRLPWPRVQPSALPKGVRADRVQGE